MKTSFIITILAALICLAEAGQSVSTVSAAEAKKRSQAEAEAQAQWLLRAELKAEKEMKMKREQWERMAEEKRMKEEERMERELAAYEAERLEKERVANERTMFIDDMKKRIAAPQSKRKRENLKHQLAVYETNPTKDTTRKFGDFKCDHCYKRWKSARAFMGYTQDCSGCGEKTLPFKLSDLKHKEGNPIVAMVPHPAELCSRCKELGHACTPSKFYC